MAHSSIPARAKFKSVAKFLGQNTGPFVTKRQESSQVLGNVSRTAILVAELPDNRSRLRMLDLHVLQDVLWNTNGGTPPC